MDGIWYGEGILSSAGNVSELLWVEPRVGKHVPWGVSLRAHLLLEDNRMLDLDIVVRMKPQVFYGKRNHRITIPRAIQLSKLYFSCTCSLHAGFTFISLLHSCPIWTIKWQMWSLSAFQWEYHGFSRPQLLYVCILFKDLLAQRRDPEFYFTKYTSIIEWPPFTSRRRSEFWVSKKKKWSTSIQAQDAWSWRSALVNFLSNNSAGISVS